MPAQEAGPSHDEVSTVHTLLQRAFETQQHENSYWHEQIMGGYQSRSYQTVCSMRLVLIRILCSRPDIRAKLDRCNVALACAN